MSVRHDTLDLDAKPGIYLVEGASLPDSLQPSSNAQDPEVFLLDGTIIQDKATFLSAVAAALAFPDYFGRNWDALDECLGDLDRWAPAAGYLIVYDHFDRFARADPTAWQTALDVFLHAIEHWRGKGIPMHVLLQGDGAVAPEFPMIDLQRLRSSDAPTTSPRRVGP